jgi:GT2 family glycosyltransferase
MSAGIEYFVGIPTKGRRDVLFRCLEALNNQTLPPKGIVVVDNNDEGFNLEIPERFGNVDKVKNNYAVLGPEQGHQTALYYAKEHTKIMVRWDDDLIPEEGCLEKLVTLVDMGLLYNEIPVYCVGGMYPREGEHRKSSLKATGDGNENHFQFFGWDGTRQFLIQKHLYSSFAYNVERAIDVGGFCVEYSQYGYRGETDFTLRMGGCVVDTYATALHLLAEGGTRDIPDNAKKVLAQNDVNLFRYRMWIRKMERMV